VYYSSSNELTMVILLLCYCCLTIHCLYPINRTTDYSKSGSNPKKSYEYLSRAANEVLNTHNSNVDEAIRLICAARQYADASHDFATLLGLVSKSVSRINKV
jgi:hypothetical protein